MNKNMLKILVISFTLIFGVFFINVDGVKADNSCSCYYIWYVEGNNSDVKTEENFYTEIKYSNSGPEVVKSCTFGYVSNQNGSRDNATTNTKSCSGKISIGSNFNVDYKNIVNNNCSVSSCNAKKIYVTKGYGGNPGELTTNVDTSLYGASQAQQKDIFNSAIEGNINRTTNADNNNDAENLTLDDIVGGIKSVKNPEKGITGTCELIDSQLIQFLKNLFIVIQVAGVILMVILTLIEFVKALTASSDDGLSGAFKNTIKRIIATVVLLILPMIIIWIINIVNDSYSDKHTQIGGDGNPICIDSSTSSSSYSGSSTKVTTSAKSSTSKKDTSSVTIKLDRTLLMIDNSHYNIAILEATLNKKGIYAAKDITWTIGNTKVAKIKNSGSLVSKSTGKKAVINGLKFGKTKVTAKLPNGKKATCELRVISSAKDSSAGSKIGAIPDAYLVKTVWTNQEVESYINNAAAIIAKYPSKYAEGKKINVNYRYGGSDPGTVHFSDRSYTYPYGRDSHNVTKPAGQLDINGYIFFYSTKDQQAYLLKKNGSGQFKVISSSEATANNTDSSFTGFLAGIHTSTENKNSYFWAISKMGNSISSSLYMNSVHIGATGFKYRSGGCTRIKKNLHDQLLKAINHGVATRYIKY